MKKLALIGGGMVLFALLTGCETVKGLGRDIMNLGDVLTGRKPSHTTPLRGQGAQGPQRNLSSGGGEFSPSDQTIPKGSP